MSTRKGLEFRNMKRFPAELLILILFLLVILVQWVLFRFDAEPSGVIQNAVFEDGIVDSVSPVALNIIDINAASEEELQMLPGVGPVTAERIVAYREEYGPFSTVEEIMDVSGVGEQTYLQIVDFITVR